MGNQSLTALLSENAPAAIEEHDIKTLFGRKVAIDASMSIYQSLIAPRQKDGEMLSNDAEETTSHLMGFRWKTAGVEEGCVIETTQKRADAKEGGSEAKETGTDEEIVSTASEANGYPGCYEAEA